MKCHYEVLGISRDAEDDEIKKSYRKLALRNHPDKNPDNIDECTKVFHLIQQAYEVLIDPQERAWYDKHREAILKGGLGKGGDYKDECLDVYQYFNTACFSGYGDDEKGFYAVYSEVFRNLVSEDLEYMDDEDSDHEFPEFGNSQSSYDEVVGPFYAFWESFSTARSYVWEEQYDTRDAPNRQIRRLMEQDNKKLRDKAKRERNEEVRALAGFVRKRDKRVQAYKKLLEERAVEIAKRAEERKQKDREKRIKTMENYEETGWSAMSGLEGDLAQLEAKYAAEYGDQGPYVHSGEEEDAEEWEEEEDDYMDDLFCVACNKEFKSDRAFANHEKSKKHKENVAFLRAQMEADEAVMVEVGEDGVLRPPGEDIEDIDDLDGLEEETQPKAKLSKKQKKKRKQQKKMEMNKEEDAASDTDILTDAVQNMKVEESTNEAAGAPSDVSMANGDAPDNTSPAPDNTSPAPDNTSPAPDNTSPATDTTPQQEEATPTGDTAAQTTNNTGKNEKHKDNKSQEKKTPQLCNKCGQTFKTRNKLFDHIKVTGHALRVDAIPEILVSAVGGGGKGRKNKKGKR